MTDNYVPPPPNPLRKSSSNPVFFADPALREGVAELFGYTVQSRDKNRNGSGNTWQMRQKLPYDPNDDDLMAWRKRLEDGADNGGDEVKANGHVSDTWPLWNSRFDLGFDL
ncbi:hypothetical protein BU25DRAFT_412696 [Macroventuria anomochaeta]|uniref:Uncharacterized protein n=1 Tax=Macroventuria anomochaeta TaxID=301207 RepID=A0ACB6RTL8_9PLEO|nr:uncharacterized protein BU25DRAFT_412696 [Macroventuria anomochaeta]KAF2625246.1 hypothetical protein BU25DRAFT_412696 [Macroventuria anomochaeta]